MFPPIPESEVEGVREGVRRGKKEGDRVGFSIYDVLGTLGTERINVGWRPIYGSKAVPTGNWELGGNTGNRPDGAEAARSVTNRISSRPRLSAMPSCVPSDAAPPLPRCAATDRCHPHRNSPQSSQPVSP